MKKIMITLVTAAALTLTGCSANSEKPIADETSSSTVESSVTSTASEVASKVESETSTNVSKPVASTTSAVSSEKPVTSTASTEKPVVSSSTTSSTTSSTKPVTSTTSTEKPAISSSTSSTKPVEAPVHSHTFAEATCEKPATCTTCGETKGNALGHKYNDGVCVYCGRIDLNYFASFYNCDSEGHYYKKGVCICCGRIDPNYFAPSHNCDSDGHHYKNGICDYCGEVIDKCERFGHDWGEYYTKTYTEDFELKESHNIESNGFDYTLAYRYGCDTNPDFYEIFGGSVGGNSGTTSVKTTATRTITDYYRKCSRCGFSECHKTDRYDHMYNEYYKYVTVNDDNWVVTSNGIRDTYPLWWDTENIPDEVWKLAKEEIQDREDWLNWMDSTNPGWTFGVYPGLHKW